MIDIVPNQIHQAKPHTASARVALHDVLIALKCLGDFITNSKNPHTLQHWTVRGITKEGAFSPLFITLRRSIF